MSDPRTQVMSLPTTDGTNLQAWLMPDLDGRFTHGSVVRFVEVTGNGYRPLVSYRVDSLMYASDWSLRLHDQDPGLTITRPWMVGLLGWIQLFVERTTVEVTGDGPDA